MSMWDVIAKAAEEKTAFDITLERTINERAWTTINTYLCNVLDGRCHCDDIERVNAIQNGVGSAWTTKAGVFSKRLSKWAHKTFGVTLKRELVDRISMYASNEAVGGAFRFDLTDTFDWYAGDFGDGGSCFWGSKESAKSILKKHGVVAIRFYNTKDGAGIARAWVAPVPKRNGFVVFNAYGYDLEWTGRVLIDWLTGREMPDGVAELRGYITQMTNNGVIDSTVYINRGRGFIVEPNVGDQTEHIDLYMKKAARLEPLDLRTQARIIDDPQWVIRDNRITAVDRYRQQVETRRRREEEAMERARAAQDAGDDVAERLRRWRVDNQTAWVVLNPREYHDWLLRNPAPVEPIVMPPDIPIPDVPETDVVAPPTVTTTYTARGDGFLEWTTAWQPEYFTIQAMPGRPGTLWHRVEEEEAIQQENERNADELALFRHDDDFTYDDDDQDDGLDPPDEVRPY